MTMAHSQQRSSAERTGLFCSRHDQSRGDSQAHKRTGAHFRDKSKSCVNLDAPTNPPMTAHPGIEARSFDVGKGCGRIKKAPVKNKVISAKDMAEASHGFITDLLSRPFMAVPRKTAEPRPE